MPNITSTLTLKQLRAFILIADLGSVTRAAEMLHQTQSSVTILLKQLEESLGVTLLDRTTRRVMLTAAGADFLESARRLLAGLEMAVTDLRAIGELRTGLVALTAAPSVLELLIAPAIAQFSASNPGIRFYLRDDTSAMIQQRVMAGTSEFGISSKWTDEPELSFVPLLRDRFGVICPSDHALVRQRKAITWNDVGQWRCVGLSADTGISSILQGRAQLPGSLSKPFYEVSSTTAVETFVGVGLGIAVVPALSAQRNPQSGLAFRVLNDPPVEREICLITRRGRSLSPAAASFLAMFQDYLARMPLPAGCKLS